MTNVTTTYLEMTSAADLKPRPCADRHFAIREASVRQWPVNRFLYRYIGEHWGWTDKRRWADESWKAYVESPGLRTFIAFYEGALAGYYELQRKDGDVEIAYFGLAAEFIGRGFGGALLTSAIEEAWRWNASRVWVHTCALDHPSALQNYEARGMRVYATSKGSRLAAVGKSDSSGADDPALSSPRPPSPPGVSYPAGKNER